MKKQCMSTRNPALQADFCEALRQGIAADGGLYIFNDWEQRQVDLSALSSTYQKLAEVILSRLIDDIPLSTLQHCIQQAYDGRFRTPDVVRVSPLENNALLELYHGPTCAFKDIALALLPELMRQAGPSNTHGKTLILTATSGDTGKAALEGFKNQPGIEILVFYPDQRISEVQQRQMVTTDGQNTHVCAVRGNFDDAQSAVKHCFADPRLNTLLHRQNLFLSSANSINLGRLLPQTVYYFYAYQQLVKNSRIRLGETVDFAVPTGNFGDILAGYYAKRMGLPIHKLIVCSNENDVLTRFFETGIYDRRPPLKKTISPSMDILVSSNLERLLAHLQPDRTETLCQWMKQLKEQGWYQIDELLLRQLQQQFAWGRCSDEQARQEIRRIYETSSRLIDPHTAVASYVCRLVQKNHPSDRPCIILSTASCFKFSRDVSEALYGPQALDEWTLMKQLSERTGIPIDPPLQQLQQLPIRHCDLIEKEDITDYILKKEGITV